MTFTFFIPGSEAAYAAKPPASPEDTVATPRFRSSLAKYSRAAMMLQYMHKRQFHPGTQIPLQGRTEQCGCQWRFLIP